MWGTFKENMKTHFPIRISEKVTSDGNSHNKAMEKNAMKNVVTPKTIPQFIVPPLDPGDLRTLKVEEKLQRESSSFTNKLVDNKESLKFEANLCPTSSSNELSTTYSPDTMKKQKFQKKKAIGQQQHPGLTLQHLLSTKAGFSTLIESPNTRRKESLFLSPLFPIRNKLGSPEDIRRKDLTLLSSSDSDISCNLSTNSSPYIKLRSKKLLGNRSTFDSDSNSSRQSTPYSSPADQRKFAKKKEKKSSYSNTADLDIWSSLHRRSELMDQYESVISSSSPSSIGVRPIKDERNETNKMYGNISNLMINEEIEKENRDSLMKTTRIRIKLAIISSQKKVNVSILEAQNFFVGKSIYFKIALLPHYYGFQKTDTIKMETENTALRERISFDSVKQEDIAHLSLEISCKEKSGRFRGASVLGKCLVTLGEMAKEVPSEFWLELKPTEPKESIHIQLSLCYDAMLGFVVAEVIGVRNIPKGSLGRYPDSYVVLTEEPQCDKNKKKQTNIKYRTKDPTFNQSFVFSMSNDKLIIVATLFLKDKVKGSWIAKGEIKLGEDVDQWSGQVHWAQALAHAGKPITHWHILMPP